MRRARAAWVSLFVASLLATGCAHLVVLHDPLSAAEHNDLGVIYETKTEPRLAAQEYHSALRLQPHWSSPRVNLGNLAAADGRWARAERHYRRALGDSATDCDAMNNLAIALLRQGRKLGEARTLAESAAARGGERDSTYRATLAEIRGASR